MPRKKRSITRTKANKTRKRREATGKKKRDTRTKRLHEKDKIRVVHRHKFKKESLVRLSSSKRIKSGDIVEFRYDGWKPVNVPGGWHHDKKPRVIVLYDDARKYLHGLNVNYLAWTYFRRLVNLVEEFPLLKQRGRMFYKLLKGTNEVAVRKGYRIYYRSVALKNARQVVPEDISP